MPRSAQQQIELFADLPTVATKPRVGNGASDATGDRNGRCRARLRFAARGRSRPLVTAPAQRVRAFAAGRWLSAARGGGILALVGAVVRRSLGPQPVAGVCSFIPYGRLVGARTG